jgi:hypothetical protein
VEEVANKRFPQWEGRRWLITANAIEMEVVWLKLDAIDGAEKDIYFKF